MNKGFITLVSVVLLLSMLATAPSGTATQDPPQGGPLPIPDTGSEIPSPSVDVPGLLPIAGGEGWEMLNFDCAGTWSTDTTVDVEAVGKAKYIWFGKQIEVEASTTTSTEINWFFSCDTKWEVEALGAGGHYREVAIRFPAGSTETNLDQSLAQELIRESTLFMAESEDTCFYWGEPSVSGCSETFRESFYDEKSAEKVKTRPQRACIEIDLDEVLVVNKAYEGDTNWMGVLRTTFGSAPPPLEITEGISGTEEKACGDINWTEIESDQTLGFI